MFFFYLGGTDYGKYNGRGFANVELFNELNVDRRFGSTLAKAANMAIAENTKSQYKTAWNHVVRCSKFTETMMEIPFTLTMTLSYVGYLMEVREVSASTINQYLAALRYIHLVNGADPSCLRPGIVGLI